MILSVTLNPCIDRAMFFDSVRLNDTNRAIRSERDAGGKGVNVSRVVAHLGGRTVATGFLGGGTGVTVSEILDRDGVELAFTEIEGETRENVSIEDLSGAAPTTFNDPGPVISEAEARRFLITLEVQLGNAEWLTIGGSNPRGIPSDFITQIVIRAQERGVKVCVDADGAVLQSGLVGRPHFIKPNRKESERLLGRTLSTPSEVVDASREVLTLLDEGPDCFAVISLGEGGAVLSTRSETYVGSCPLVSVRSTVGCGDSLVAGVLWALQGGCTHEEALRWGIAAGASTATSDGCDIGTAQMARELFERVSVVPHSKFSS